MYSKEQLEAFSKCASYGDCDNCPNFELSLCDWSNGEITENLAKALLAEMKTRESVERKLKIVKTALELVDLYCEGYENE